MFIALFSFPLEAAQSRSPDYNYHTMNYTRALEAALMGLVVFHMLLSPYTKVEESFNIQAVHDMLNYGVYPREVLQNYDHTEFPGVVPRTFVGSLLIAGGVKAVDLIYSLFAGESFIADREMGQLHVQIVARGLLGLANVFGIMFIRRSLDRILTPANKPAHGNSLGFFYTLMFLSQFHILFYATRTLPNFVVLPVVNFGLSKIIIGDMSGLSWIAFAGVIFRLEVGVLAASIALVSSLVFGQSNLFQNVMFLIVSSAIGCFVSFNVDSYFWGTSVLPELVAFKFNVVAGKAVEWGVEPYTAYFTKYIVNFFRPPHVLFLSVFGLGVDPARLGLGTLKSSEQKSPSLNSLRVLAISALLFVAIMSYQPHKEWRFIVYTIPIFNAVAGNGLNHLWNGHSKLLAHKLLFFLMIVSTGVAFVLSTFMSFASSFNYPGGQAINWVNDYITSNNGSNHVLVHMDVPACMTGITKFTQFHNSAITYDKTENEGELAHIWNDINILITHKDMNNAPLLDFLTYDALHWKELKQISAFANVRGVGFVTDLLVLAKSPETRARLVTAIFMELKEGKADTLQEFLRRSVVLKTYLRVYERTEKDVLPQNPGFRKSIQYVDDKEKSVKPPIADITPEMVKEDVNEQIDELEDEIKAHIADEL